MDTTNDTIERRLDWDTFPSQVRVALATEMVLGGRLGEARAFLAPDGRVPTDPEVLDLLARIAAKRGDLRGARRLWEIALKAEPSHAPSQEGLEELKEIRGLSALGYRVFNVWGPEKILDGVLLILGVALVGLLAFGLVNERFTLIPGMSDWSPPGSEPIVESAE